ncbi:MAG: hypothetical protein AAF211_11375 [Myxococcota bacterium]
MHWIALMMAWFFLALPGRALAQSGDDDGLAMANASPPEQIAWVQDARAEIGAAEKTLARMREQQEKQDDANAVECLVTRLTSVQALRKVTTSAQTSLVSAVAAGSQERVLHELRKVNVALTKTRSLVGEAQRCAAGQAFETGITTTDVTQELTSSDAFVVPEITPLDTNVDPPQVSPFL